ncbi:sister chromatid cohesion protein PDS5 [Achlya hypogyna]|uniref:Sister chromatid cohesion protein PDS5 n=1 Tax=Achlya hypogyna TaxID=1202772 RepID=A0A1V9Z2R6_ACHHY|nr:sister chromatid cohesion protein PDS5 [Achlya hypogyna]
MARPKQAGSTKGKAKARDAEPKAKTKSAKATRSSAADVPARLTAELQRLRGLSNGALGTDETATLGRELSTADLIKTSDSHVRLLVASCVAELFRITAPDSPFASDQVLFDVFGVIIRALHDTTKETDVAWLGLLETLAAVKSCNLAVGLRAEVDDRDLVVDLFKCLFERLQDDHSAKVEANMVAIMVGCLEESAETLGPAVLETLLEPLLDASKARSYRLAQHVIEKAADVLQSHLSTFFNGALVDVRGASEHSVLKEHTHKLVYEVHKVHPGLLLYVLPNVCLQLQVDDFATRSSAIALMGRLFASSHADYGAQYLKNFREFLDRFRDVDKRVRLQMLQVCAIIFQRKPDLAPLIEPEMALRLQDPDWEVRQLAVNELCDLANVALASVSVSTLRQIGERMKDKKVVIRKEAMTGLAQIYAAHVATALATGAQDGTAAAAALGWVPDYVLKCFAYPQQELKLRAVQLLDDILLPKGASELLRMKGLVFIWKQLDAAAKEALRRIHTERLAARDAVVGFLRIKQLVRHKKNMTTATPEVAHMVACLGELQPLLPETDGWRALAEKLALWKDHKLVKHLDTLTAAGSAGADLRAARDDVVKLLGSKTPLGAWMKNVCRKVAMATLNAASVGCLLALLPESRDAKPVAELLEFAAAIAPQLFAPHLNTLEALLDDDVQALCVLRVLGAYGKHRLAQPAAPAPDTGLLAVLLGAAQHSETATIVLAATRALVRLFPAAPGVRDWHRSLAAAPFVDDGPLLALAALTKHVRADDAALVAKALAVVTATGALPKPKKKEVAVAAAAVKVLVHALPHAPDEARAALDALVPLLATSAALLRKAVATGLLVLVRTPALERALTLTEWRSLAYTTVDEDVGVREAVGKKLAATLLRHALAQPHKYTAVLALAAAAEPMAELRKTARGALAASVQRLRRAFEAQEADEDEASALLVPEYTLPFVVHLMLHAQQAKVAEASAVLLDALVPAAAAEADNIAFLLQMLHKMSLCHDVTHPGSSALYKLLPSISAALKAKIKNPANLKPYPGQIFLPKELFAPGRSAPDDGASDADDAADVDEPVPKKKRTLKAPAAPRPKKAKPTSAADVDAEDLPSRQMPSRRVKQAAANLADQDSDVDEEAAEAAPPASSIRAYFTPKPKSAASPAPVAVSDEDNEEETKGSDDEEEAKDSDDEGTYRRRRRR